MLINVYFIITDPIFHIATVKNLTIFKLHIPIYISLVSQFSVPEIHL